MFKAKATSSTTKAAKTCIRQIHSIPIVDESANENDKDVSEIETKEAKRVDKTDFLVFFSG